MSNLNIENKPLLPNREIIGPPEISIDFVTKISGKHFYHNNATDFQGERSLSKTFDLIHSPWAEENIYRQKSNPEKAISGNRIQICAFSSNFSENYSFINIEWFTEADWAQQLGEEPKGWRTYPQTEMKHIDTPQNNISKILESGYPLFSTLANTKNMIMIETAVGLAVIDRNPLEGSTPDEQYFSITFITDQDHQIITPQHRIISTTSSGYRMLKENKTNIIGDQVRNLTEPQYDRSYGLMGLNEQAVIDKNGTKLWDFPEIAENKNFQVALKTAFNELKNGKKIIVLKANAHETQMPVLIAQTLSQMLLQEGKPLISWTTQFKAFYKTTRNAHELGKNMFDFDLSFATREDLDKLGVADDRLVIDLSYTGLID